MNCCLARLEAWRVARISNCHIIFDALHPASAITVISGNWYCFARHQSLACLSRLLSEFHGAAFDFLRNSKLDANGPTRI